MLLSLVLAAIIIAVAIALTGISPLGSQLIGQKGTVSYEANATVWNTYASMGALNFAIIIVAVVLGVVGLLAVSLLYGSDTAKVKRT